MGRKLFLEYVNVLGIEIYEVYCKNGGYWVVEKVLKLMLFDQVVEEVKILGFCGCGGVGFFIGMKWLFFVKLEGVLRYLLCNVDELELGIFKDCYLMEKILYLLVEGMIVFSYVLGVN